MLFLLALLAGGAQDPLRIGDDERFVALAPFVQADLGLGGHAADGRRPDAEVEGTDLNIARLYVLAASGSLSGEASFDLGEERRVVKAFITYRASPRISLVAGQIDEPFSMTAAEGSRAQTFIDGAETNALIPGENLGLAAYWDGGSYALSGGIFGGDIATGAGQEGAGFSLRATWNPTGRKDTVTHLGAGVAARSGADFQAGFVSGVGAGLLPRPVLSVGSFEDVERIERANLEAAYAKGSLVLQGEASIAQVTRDGAAEATARAFYAAASYLVTGETRRYETDAFGQIAPARPASEGGPGAWELALRLDGADLGEAGETARLTGAVNWHVNRKVRLSVNLSHTDVSRGRDGREREGDVSAVIFRFQYVH